MALSETNRLKISQILNILASSLVIHLDSFTLSTATQTAIEAQIILWDAGAGTKTTRLEPKESNKGVRTNPDDARQSIRKNIAVLLERPDWAGSGAYLDRG